MGQLYVYEPWPDAVDTMGLCGPLTPTSVKYGAGKNAEMELTIQHPIDDAGKWANLTDGRLIKAQVPMRNQPLIKFGEAHYIINPTRYVVSASASRADRAVMSGAPYYNAGLYTTPFRLTTIPVGESVFVLGTVFSWSWIAWRGGRGYVLTSILESAETSSGTKNRSYVETVLPSPRMREQLFRIYKVSPSDGGIQVSARHVSYDIMGSLITYAATTTTCDIALSNVFLNGWWGMVNQYVWANYYTNITDPEVDLAGWTRAGQIEALLAPSNSIVSYWNATILRDNWQYSILSDASYNSGCCIEYGRNMLGVQMDVDSTDIIDSLIPVGQTYKGKPLTVPAGTYTVDGASVTVQEGGVVQSPSYTYPIPHTSPYDLGDSIKAAGTTSAQLNAAYVKLIRAALKKFADEQCDLPAVTLRVDFLRLGDTAEYAQYREMDKLFLHDLVRVKHPILGIDVTTEVNKITWDCLLDRYDSIELGNVRKNYARSRLAPWQVPGLASLQSYVDTISSLI